VRGLNYKKKKPTGNFNIIQVVKVNEMKKLNLRKMHKLIEYFQKCRRDNKKLFKYNQICLNEVQIKLLLIPVIKILFY
jgi:hypothetical protein